MCWCALASSAPIERVFNHGGLILNTNRARTSDAMLSSLIFLKCNAMDYSIMVQWLRVTFIIDNILYKLCVVLVKND